MWRIQENRGWSQCLTEDNIPKRITLSPADTSPGWSLTPPVNLVSHSLSFWGIAWLWVPHWALSSSLSSFSISFLSVSVKNGMSLVLRVDKSCFQTYSYHFLVRYPGRGWSSLGLVISSRKCWQSAISHRVTVQIHYNGSRGLAQYLACKCSSNDSHGKFIPVPGPLLRPNLCACIFNFVYRLSLK